MVLFPSSVLLDVAAIVGEMRAREGVVFEEYDTPEM